MLPMKKSYLTACAAIFLFIPYCSHAQGLLNLNGADVYTAPGSLIFVDSDVAYTGGNIYHNGSLNLTGNWLNNGDTTVFDKNSVGWVNLVGDVQSIQGHKTSFPSLALDNTSPTNLYANADVMDTLNINANIMMLNGHDVSVLNSATGAIMRNTGGYINTTSDKNGHLVRAVTTNNNYEYPFGGGVPERYRPLTVTPTADGQIAGQFLNYDPNNDGYERRKTNGNFDDVNWRYYHTVQWVNIGGGGPMQVTVPYSTEQDTMFNTLAQWTGVYNNWTLTSNPSEYAVVGETTDRAAQGIVTDTGLVPLGLAHFVDNTNLFIVTAFTPNGDGRNDAFVIKGLQNYKYNELEIYNRWGQMIYNRINYKNDWKGEGLDIGVYMYQLRAVDYKGVEHYYKGDITLLR